MEEEKHICHTCGADALTRCQHCEQDVCEDCLMPFTQMNQIDYDLCNDCNSSHEDDKAEEAFEEYMIEKLGIEGFKRYRDNERAKKIRVKAIRKSLITQTLNF